MTVMLGPTVDGYCPMGCGRMLFLGEGGQVTCSYISCPRPDAVARLLEDEETEHVVVFGPDVSTVRHPLRERLDDALMRCALHEWMAGHDGPPVEPGRYRAVERPGGGSWTFHAEGNERMRPTPDISWD